MSIKNKLDKTAEAYAIKAQEAVGRVPKGITSTQVLALLAAVGDELDRQREINGKLVKAIEFLVDEVASNNNWIGKLIGEITNSEDRDENISWYWEKLREIIPSNMLEQQ